MLLIRLSLENFRQHQRTEIEFQPGMTAIVGANGTGKTTLLEAITYALYGSQRDNKDTIRFYWAGDGKRKFAVTLAFELDGKRYTVERTNADASLVEHLPNGENILAAGLVDVKHACEKLIGLTYDQFTNSFCAEQKNLNFLNFRTSAQRQDEVARMLGFDRLKGAEESAKNRRSEMKARAETLEKTLGNVADLEADRKAAAAKLKEVQGQIGSMEKQLKVVAVEIGPTKEKRDEAELWQSMSAEMEKIAGTAAGLKEAVKLSEKALTQAKSELAELTLVEPKEQEYRRTELEAKEWDRRRDEDRKREMMQAEAKTLRCEVLDLDTRLKELKAADMSTLEKELMGACEALERAETKVREMEGAWQAKKTKAQEALAAAQANANHADSALKRCQELLSKGICPECGQALGENYAAILERAKTESAKRESELKKAKTEATEVSAKPENLEAADGAAAAAKSRVEERRALRDAAALAQAEAKTLMGERKKKAEQAAKLEATLANTPAIYCREKHDRARKDLEKLEPAHQRYLALKGCEASLPEKERDHQESVKKLDQAKAAYRKLEAERGALPFKSATEAAAAIAAHHHLETQARDLETCLKSTKEILELAASALQQAESRINEHRERARELAETRKAAAEHDTVAKEMRSLREALNRTIGPDLSTRASENLNLLTNGRYATLELDKDFNATVIEDDISKAVISGGEEDVVALSLRLALSELIQERNGRPMSLLILDEVFGSLDFERRQAVMDRLAALKGRFRQILVISHIDEINQVADQALYLIRDPDTRATLVSDAPPDPNAMLL